MTHIRGKSPKVYLQQVWANMADKPRLELSEDEMDRVKEFQDSGLEPFRAAEKILKSRVAPHCRCGNEIIAIDGESELWCFDCISGGNDDKTN